MPLQHVQDPLYRKGMAADSGMLRQRLYHSGEHPSLAILAVDRS